ncbi:uncharacterized protein LOC110979712 [Acanthaster planci]|uniref:Uncharacterized protein LOC110979712 n=1 Tax=Acanthaster planci TaxID=133434 RepID=A0A8B7YDW1_ACAPL|nr:uncharacterized protein LOC110979712 [Acanthaster planci]
MTSVPIVDTLVINTQTSGQCCIELCQGDITELDVKDKVDVICVSVLGRDYCTPASTLIGALQHKLNLSIRELAKDKEEDLRHAYMCWWSKPLPKKLPYKKLLCFENTWGRYCPQELVANVFRCLVPILNNEPGTVITPLLNTGGQGHDEVAILVGMVEAAAKWMKAGLPLKKLKIVLYATVFKGKITTMRMRDPEGILTAFRNLKERFSRETFIPMAVPLEYDIYLSHCAVDSEIASMVEAKLLASKPGIRIYKGRQDPADDRDEKDGAEGSFWQEDMYKIMSRCARVVPILSPSFLESKACVDLYNMALCCNRRAQRDLLAPLYIESIQDMPTYMGLVQYIDCSPKDEVKISDGCAHLVQSLEHASMKVHIEMVIADASPLHYDIFVSYSHRDSKLAIPVVEKLQRMNPDLRIFFDIQELKAGTTWQKMLYHAIDGCRSFMALVSNSYMKSAMCIEEFNLALAKHCSLESQLRLVPVCIEPLVDPLLEFRQVKLINAKPGVFEPAMEIICTSLVDWIAGRDWHPQLDSIFKRKMERILDASEYAVERRRLEFTLKYGRGEKMLKRDDVNYPPSLHGVYCRSVASEDTNSEDAPCDVAFSCAPEDRKFVSFATKILREVSPGLIIKETADTENERLALMESAQKVVVFLSANYLESVEQVEEFHTILLRQRYRSPTQVLFPITLHNLPQLPTYFHLIPSEFNLFDPLWVDLFCKHVINIKALQQMYKVHADHWAGRYENIGMIAAIHSLLVQLKNEREQPPALKTSQQPMLLNVLLLRAEVNRLYQKVKEAGAQDGDSSDTDGKGGSSHEGSKDAESLDDDGLLHIVSEVMTRGKGNCVAEGLSDSIASEGDELNEETKPSPEALPSSTEARSQNVINSQDSSLNQNPGGPDEETKKPSLKDSSTEIGRIQDTSPIIDEQVADRAAHTDSVGRSDEEHAVTGILGRRCCTLL